MKHINNKYEFGNKNSQWFSDNDYCNEFII